MPTLRNRLIRLAHENPDLRGDLLPFIKSAEESDLWAKFEEGEPADPTKHMSPEDAKEWWKHHSKHKDNFKNAAALVFTEQVARNAAGAQRLNIAGFFLALSSLLGDKSPPWLQQWVADRETRRNRNMD